MTEKARQYKPSTLKRLFTLSGNQCAKPDCTKKLIAEDNKSIISKISHIEAVSVEGTRYNPEMNDDDRRHFNNLILLCDEHHIVVDNKDNEAEYPVSLLREWKRSHESKLLHKTLHDNPTLLNEAINAISEIKFDDSIPEEKVKPFNIEDKISYNAIKRNIPLIEEYKIYYSQLDILYQELEIAGSFRKDKLLRTIKAIYLKTKGKYVENVLNQIEIIRKNADNIIEDIENQLLELIENDSKHYKDDITFGISVIMVDAFMRCKILEEPKK